MINCKCLECIFNDPVKEKCTNTDITIIPLTMQFEDKTVVLSYVCAEGTEDFFANTEDEIVC